MRQDLKLLFLTTHNLATNPRLYKEISLAKAAGFQVQVVCFEFENWSKGFNESLKKNLGETKLICIPAGRRPLYPWLMSVIMESICRLLGKHISLPLPFLAQAVSRRNYLLLNALKSVEQPHWVIGHNPGALYATVVAGKQFACKTGFDVEDYHPGEGDNANLQAYCKQLIAATLPLMHYVSFASPLIKKEVEKDIQRSGHNWFTVMNLFPASDFSLQNEPVNGRLKLVWFSQNISFGRGLEWIIPIVRSNIGNLELHLIGNLDHEFFEKVLKGVPNVICHQPMSQKDLHYSLKNFDIGLALEPAKDRNNDLAVSNKILAYLQAGLYVVATDTNAQRTLLQTYPEHGIIVDFWDNNAEKMMERLIEDLEHIRDNKRKRFQNFRTNNWEEVALNLLATWADNEPAVVET